jgi:hypothetical protein
MTRNGAIVEGGLKVGFEANSLCIVLQRAFQVALGMAANASVV